MDKPAHCVIFDIQRFSLHDGPGLRTTLFFKGCPLSCRWCQNPESHSTAPEMAFYTERCRGCFECEKVCPAGAILRNPGQRIDHSHCTVCGLCAGVCTTGALRLIGCEWQAPQLADEVSRDRDFFIDSGGGVTLSGGEPMLHSGFIAELCRLLKNRGIHIVMETAGHVQPELFDKLSGLIDIYYFDIKHSDSEKHRALTDCGNDLIFRSFRHLTDGCGSVQPRMPVIPGTNDDEVNIRNTARLISNAGLSSIHCLPWHGLGNSKLPRLDSVSMPFESVAPDRDMMERVRSIFYQEGIDARICQ